MRYFLLVYLFSFQIEASELITSLSTKVDSIRDTSNKTTYMNFVSELQREARALKSKSKGDREFYFLYDFDKSLDIVLRLKKFNVDECYRAKIEHFSAYGVRSDNFKRSDLPDGAKLSYDILLKLCQ
ncbi:hypothetical protein A9Q84_11900 [Halobacteriovorax marinus]|uniref:Uncharacterized protein n=1 Tax=Halobacteriovorax marinus TaxID=97084 RepID=A0A1Y5FDI7_9BACT|nr:hypothetical protein A9Q84_11900 [Halobacteriovorax marinus]